MRSLKQDIKDGLGKEEAFDNVKIRGGNLKKASRYLARLPDSSNTDKYNLANNVLIFLYLAWEGFGLLFFDFTKLELPVGLVVVFFAIVLFPHVIVTYLLLKKNANGYMFLSFLYCYSITRMFDVYQEDPTSTLICAVIVVSLLIFVVTLKGKLFPYQNFFNTKKDDNGHYIFKPELES